MKWLLLIFSIIKPFFATDSSTINPVNEIKEMIKANAMKVIGLFAAAFALANIFAAGIIIIAVDIGAQYDQNAYVYFSSMMMMGLTLSLLSLIVAIGGSKMLADETRKEKEREVLSSVGTAHPLQDALALLVSDFVKERELRRSQEDFENVGRNVGKNVERTPTKEQSTEDFRH